MPEWFLKGGPVMYPLLACSFLAGVIFLERIFYFVYEKGRRRSKILKDILALFKAGKVDAARDKALQCKDFAAKVLSAGLQPDGRTSLLSMQSVAANQLDQCQQNLPLLQTIITLSPLLGILGTVLGIIDSFQVLGASAIVEPRAVTNGVAEALITTAFGLTIAILTLIPYNFFTRRCEKIQNRIEYYATQLEVLVSNNEIVKKSQ